MDTKTLWQTLRYMVVALLLLTNGCASVHSGENRDPFEPFNRQVYAFNSDLDTKVVKPVAESYDRHVPVPIKTSVSNFFSNLNDLIVLLNDVLQLKGRQAASDTLRLSVNTVFGLAGLFDIATPAGLPKHDEDFGQTLGYWGVQPGPYLVLPFFGPSDIRDTGGLLVDLRVDPLWNVRSQDTEVAAILLKTVDTRAGLLKASRVFEQAALDPYIFLRDAYLQRRRNLVYDGNPPREKFEDFNDDLEPPPSTPAPTPTAPPR